MPPMPSIGNSATVQAWVEGGLGQPPHDDFRFIVTSANRMPAVANYIRNPGEAHYSPYTLDVLRIEDGRIVGEERVPVYVVRGY